MNWALKRRLYFIFGFLAIVAMIATAIYFLRIYQPPSCTDGKQNQNEEGIDCGGVCAIVCRSQIVAPVIFWQRSFEIVHGVYNAVAYIENPNPDLGVGEAVYKFKLYDDKNIFITERIGKTFIAPNERFAVFEARLLTGEKIPKRTTFEFISYTPWTKIVGEKPTLSVVGEKISDITSKPKATAMLENKLLVPVNTIDVTAILYDVEDNAIGASATEVDSVAPESSYTLVFTWLKPFFAKPVRLEVIPRINPFNYRAK